MANKTKIILEKTKDELETNATFTAYINQTYILQALQEGYIPDIHADPPIAFVYPASGSVFTPLCFPDTVNSVLYTIGVSIFQEYWDKNYGLIGDGSTIKGVAEIESDVMTVFDRNTLDDTVLSTVFRGASYSPIGLSMFADQTMHQVHCTLECFDVDMR